MPLESYALINHGIPTPQSSSAADSSLSIAELYMSKRFIPFDQLRTALITTILCPSASAEQIESILEMLELSNVATRRTTTMFDNDEATVKYQYYSGGRVDEIPRNSCSSEAKRISAHPNGIMSMSPLSATDYVPAKDVLQINRADVRNGKLNIFTNSPDEDDKEKQQQRRKKNAREDCRDGEIDNARTSTDYNRNAAATQAISSSTSVSSFPETAARIVTASPLTKTTSNPVQLGDIVIAASTVQSRSATAASLARDLSSVVGMRTGSTSPTDPTQGVAADDCDEFLNEEIKINFRTWCGVVAFAERYTTKILKENDTRHEVRGR